MSSLHVGAAWKLSPSDLTFLFEECPRCFWLKVAGNFPRPRTPFPRVFTLLDLQAKAFFDGKRSERISPDLPPGRIVHGDRRLRSMPIHVPGHDRRLFIVGRIDSAIGFDDGSFAIVDYKTTVPKPHHAALYGRQLHAYALAAETPAPGSLMLKPVTRLGLLCFEPTRMTATRGGAAYRGETHWIEVTRRDGEFMAFLGSVADLLDRPTPPEATAACSFCSYLADGVTAILGTWLGSEGEEPVPPSGRRRKPHPHLELVVDPTEANLPPVRPRRG